MFSLLRYGAEAGLFEHSFETQGSMKDTEYSDDLSDCQFVKEGPYSITLGCRHIICTFDNKLWDYYAETELD